MILEAQAPKSVRPPQLYRGAETCDFAPEWCDTSDPELLSLLRGTFDADPDELTPQLMLADLLAERNDPREAWVRAGVELWSGAAVLEPGSESWNYETARATLTPVCETVAGRRLAGLWGCLVAWHGPSGYEGVALGRTWADARVKVVQRCLWFWSLGFLATSSLEHAAYSQAYAAESQAYAAESQAYAAESLAYAAESQAYAAESQAYAAGRLALLWRYSRACWEQLCAPLVERLSEKRAA